jgi:hypothetical protein
MPEEANQPRINAENADQRGLRLICVISVDLRFGFCISLVAAWPR